MLVSRPSRSRGSALIWVVVALPVLVGLCSLAVDWGRVQLAKTELRHAADTAARHAAHGVGQGISVVRSRAKDAADDNTADGSPVVLADADVVQGSWSAATKQFTPNGTPVNAVQVSARRTGASGVPLIFAAVLGKSRFDVQASAVALFSSSAASMGFVGLNGITFHNNTFVGSYNPNVIKTPPEGYSTGKGSLGSNGVIQSHNNTVLKGGLTLGPSATTISTPAQGTTTRLPAPIMAPPDPVWNPGANPLGLPQNYTVNGATTLPGGTYWFRSLTLAIDGRLDFSGPATVYVDGNISVEKNAITAYQQVPSNLKLYQLGNNRSFTTNNNFTFVGQLIAPRSDLVANNMFTLFGTALFRSIELKNNALIFLDETSLTPTGTTGGTVALVR